MQTVCYFIAGYSLNRFAIFNLLSNKVIFLKSKQISSGVLPTSSKFLNKFQHDINKFLLMKLGHIVIGVAPSALIAS